MKRKTIPTVDEKNCYNCTHLRVDPHEGPCKHCCGYDQHEPAGQAAKPAATKRKAGVRLEDLVAAGMYPSKTKRKKRPTKPVTKPTKKGHCRITIEMWDERGKVVRRAYDVSHVAIREEHDVTPLYGDGGHSCTGYRVGPTALSIKGMVGNAGGFTSVDS
jgi:hypothetical protein